MVARTILVLLPALSLLAGEAPDVREARYGPHERNVVDLWKADGDGPRPLVVYFHGGGFRSGSKEAIDKALLAKLLDAGISVAAANYRLSSQAPFPAPMHDAARAIQFLRSKAKEWNLDPERFAATGGSAGAGISLWLVFHDDLADPKSDDPIARESTRLHCAAVTNGQSSYDPHWIRERLGYDASEDVALVPFYGLDVDEWGSEEAKALFAEASPITHLTKDDPCVFLGYTYPDTESMEGLPRGHLIHHPRFGVILGEAMKELGIECELDIPESARGRGGKDPTKLAEFLIERLQ